ncbi:MAG: IPTL-CTERM sorting domain-containing protein [Phycisphaerales bacterium]|nr:MAG: IPTL-CTERM sorting domain-containing protein [Phycisphaerales bacterium]
MKAVVGAAVSLAVALLAATPAEAQCGCAVPACGPGAHWIDQCAAGVDNWAVDGAIVGIDMDGDCKADVSLVMGAGGAPLIVNRLAPSDDSAQYPGLRPTDGHLDVIDTEIVQMNLSGGGYTLWAGIGQGTNPAGALANNSYGAIAEFTADPTRGESFFDVYFELFDGTNYMYNQTALRVQVDASGILCVPPDCQYFKAAQCLPLYTAQTGGTVVAWLTVALHVTGQDFLEAGACCDPATGQCVEVTLEYCDFLEWIFHGYGTQCLGDADGNGIDDACEGVPAVSTWGLLVLAILVAAAAVIVMRRRRPAT